MALLEGFENTPFTGGGTIGWTEAGDTGSYTRTTNNVTEGTYSWRASNTAGAGDSVNAAIFGIPVSAPLDLSSATGILLDVTVVSVDSNVDYGGVVLSIFDSTETIEVSTPDGTTGSFTLTALFSSNPSFNPADIQQINIAARAEGATSSEITADIDNLRDDLGNALTIMDVTDPAEVMGVSGYASFMGVSS